MRKILLASVAALGLAAGAMDPASAAFINNDDSDPDTITISAGDFERGFSVNGNLLTTGLGNSGSITLPDGGYSISGTWIDLGAAQGQRVDIQFALPGNPTFATSGIEFGATSASNLATLSGSFGGFVDPSLYFFTGVPTVAQDGHTENGGVAFLSVSFVSENPVPAPASALLLGSLLPALAALRRRAA